MEIFFANFSQYSTMSDSFQSEDKYNYMLFSLIFVYLTSQKQNINFPDLAPVREGSSPAVSCCKRIEGFNLVYIFTTYWIQTTKLFLFGRFFPTLRCSQKRHILGIISWISRSVVNRPAEPGYFLPLNEAIFFQEYFFQLNQMQHKQTRYLA